MPNWDDYWFAGVVIFNCICGIVNAFLAQRNFENLRVNAELARSLSETAAKFGYVVLSRQR